MENFTTHYYWKIQRK